MKINLPSVLVCGVREFTKNKGKEGEKTSYMLDWYCDGAKTSFIEQEKLDAYRSLIARMVSMDIDIIEGRNGIMYKILGIEPLAVRKGA